MNSGNISSGDQDIFANSDVVHPTNTGYESLPTPDLLSSDDVNIGGALGEIPDLILLDKDEISPIQDQYEDGNYAACGAYSASHSTNVMNVEEGTYGISEKTTSTGIKFWDIQKKEYRGSDLYGSYQMDNIEMLEKYNFIAGKYWCRNQKAVDDALNTKFAISTGSKEIDRAATRKNNNRAVRGKGSAHLFTIVGKDEINKEYIVRDSGGKDKRYSFDNGYFYIPFDMYDVLYSCYALIDKTNQDIIDKAAADKSLLQRAISMGITNGSYLQAYAERWMAAIFFARIAKYPTTGYGDEELMHIAKDLFIWNATRPNNFVTRYEIALMAAGVLGVRTEDDQESIQNIIDLGIMKDAEEVPILREHLVFVVMRVLDRLQEA